MIWVYHFDEQHKIWTPEMGKSALGGSSVEMILAEAETKRIQEWEAVQRAEIQKVWEKGGRFMLLFYLKITIFS